MTLVTCHASGFMTASLVRGDGSALHLTNVRMDFSPFDPGSDIESLVGLLVRLQRAASEEAGEQVSELLCYVPPRAPADAWRKLELAAFAAGWKRSRSLTLAQLAPIVSSAPLTGRTLAFDASPDGIDALEIRLDGDGTSHALRNLSTALQPERITQAFQQLLKAQGDAELVNAHPELVTDLAGDWWSTVDSDWILDAYCWTPHGWRAVSICGESAEQIDASAKADLRPLCDSFTESRSGTLIVMGSLAPRIGSLVETMSAGRLACVAPVTTSIVEAAVQWQRSVGARLSPSPPAPSVEVSLVLHSQLMREGHAADVRAQRGGARVVIPMNERLEIPNLSVTAHVDGILVESRLYGTTHTACVFSQVISRIGQSQFSIVVFASPLSDGRIAIRLECPQGDLRAVVEVNPHGAVTTLEFHLP